MKREIGFLIFPGFQLLDLSGPLAAFEVAGRMAGDAYSTRVMSLAGGAVASSSGLEVFSQAINETALDTFIVVGGSQCLEENSVSELSQVTLHCASKARRITSICTGAFVLANAGRLGP